MRIAEFRTTVVGTPWRDLVFVEVVTDTGIVGIGEVRPLNKTDSFCAIVDEVGTRHVVGMDPYDTERLAWAVERLDYGRPGEHGQSALAAFDIACWDVIGQDLGVPIWKLLGGRFRDRVPAYANGWYRAEYEPSLIADLATQVVGRGYRAMKLDPFGAASVRLSAGDSKRAVAVVAAVREAVGPDIDLMLEFHGRFSPDTAAQIAAAMQPYAPRWIEEPVPPERANALGRVRIGTNLSIASGERVHSIWDSVDLIESGHVDIVQMDMTHFGGFTGMRRIAGWTEAHYLTMAPHNVGGPVATAANIHLAVATRNVEIVEHFNDFDDPWIADLVDSAPAIDPSDGCFAVPERPGLGLRLDAARAAEHPRTGAHLRLFTDGWQMRKG